MSLLPKILPRSQDDRRAAAYRQMVRHYGKAGGQLFGPVPAGHNREFFCLDEHTWVWHEDWVDEQGAQQSITTRYDIRPQGVIKSRGDGQHYLVKGEELKNLYAAAKLYRRNLQADLASMRG